LIDPVADERGDDERYRGDPEPLPDDPDGENEHRGKRDAVDHFARVSLTNGDRRHRQDQ
jgi:hypothetical protein